MKHVMGWKTVLGIAAAFWLASGAIADKNMYKWIDSQGKVHYSDQPPPPDAREAHAMKRSTGDVFESDSEGASDAYLEQEEQFQRRRTEKAEAEEKLAKESAAKADRERNCNLARNNLQSLINGGRITRRNAQGEVEYLNDSEIAVERVAAQGKVDEWCGS